MSVAGFGYWSGQDVQIQFRPAPANTGIVFVRHGGGHERRIAACANCRIEIPRRTTLASDGATVEMIEHVMAALSGVQVDNCEVWVDQPEIPGCDGSSQPFVDVLQQAGFVEQDAPRAELAVSELVRVGNGDHWVEARPPIGGEFRLCYELDYGSRGPIGRQTIELDIKAGTFQRELAAARTFVLKEEANLLRSQGLGTRVTFADLLVFDQSGPVDNTLRFPDECVRHKMLDLVGDLALAGCDLAGRFVAHRSGHRLNAELVRALLAQQSMAGEVRCIA